MNWKLMLLICTGVVFLILLLSYIISTYQKNSFAKQKKKALVRAYSDGSLKRIEYDLVPYDGQSEDGKVGQVTIDEMLGNDKDEWSAQEGEDEEVFTRIDYDGIEEIVGKIE